LELLKFSSQNTSETVTEELLARGRKIAVQQFAIMFRKIAVQQFAVKILINSDNFPILNFPVGISPSVNLLLSCET